MCTVVCARTGLDAATSKDILTVLNRLTQTGCSVLLTIHQPRIEIFHMFHKILLFAEGRVAYFGSPFKAISYFTEKLQEKGMHFKVRTYVCMYVPYTDVRTYVGGGGEEEGMCVFVNLRTISGNLSHSLCLRRLLHL